MRYDDGGMKIEEGGTRRKKLMKMKKKINLSLILRCASLDVLVCCSSEQKLRIFLLFSVAFNSIYQVFVPYKNGSDVDDYKYIIRFYDRTRVRGFLPIFFFGGGGPWATSPVVHLGETYK